MAIKRGLTFTSSVATSMLLWLHILVPHFSCCVLVLASHPGDTVTGSFGSTGGSASGSSSSSQLPFTLPFDRTSFNRVHLSQVAAADTAGGVAFWKLDAGDVYVAMATTSNFVALGMNPSTPSMAGSDIECERASALQPFSVPFL